MLHKQMGCTDLCIEELDEFLDTCLWIALQVNYIKLRKLIYTRDVSLLP